MAQAFQGEVLIQGPKELLSDILGLSVETVTLREELLHSVTYRSFIANKRIVFQKKEETRLLYLFSP